MAEVISFAVLKLGIDDADLERGLAKDKAMTAAAVREMQRSMNELARGTERVYGQATRAVEGDMAKITASTGTMTNVSVRELDKMARAVLKTEGAINSLADTMTQANREIGDSMLYMSAVAHKTSDSIVADYAKEAAAAKASADVQIAAAARVAAARTAAAAAGGGGAGAPGGPGGPGGAGGAGDRGGGFGASFLGAMFGDSSGSPFTRRVSLPFMRFGLPVAGAAMGSPAAFAGLGVEHLLMTVLGLAGSAAGGAAGAATLAGGSIFKMLVGGGSDIAAMKTAAANVQNTTKAIDNYNVAVATYGKNSAQAITAQKQMNFAIHDMPKQVQASNLALAKGNLALENYWKAASAGAVLSANSIFMQVQDLAHQYVPMVAHAAQTNLSYINQGIKPLFAWLRGPDGVQIFQNLENEFRAQLPTAVHAGSQAIEFILRYFNEASKSTGGLVRWMDHLFTRLNSMSNPQIDTVIQHLIRDFDLWKNLVKALGVDIALLFRNDVGTAQGILTTLTHMLNKVGAWERTIHAREQISTIFQVHKQEVIALLHTIGLLLPTFMPVYMTLAPPLTRIFTILVEGLNGVLKLLRELPGGDWLIALSVLAIRFKGIGTYVNFLRGGLGAIITLLGKFRGEENLLTKLGGLIGGGGRSAARTAEQTAARTAGSDVVKTVETGAAGGAAGGLGLKALNLIRYGGEGAMPYNIADLLPTIAKALGPWVGLIGAMYGISKLINAGGVKPLTTKELQQPPGQLIREGRFSALRQAQFSDPLGTARNIADHADQVRKDQQAMVTWIHTAENGAKVSGMNAQQLQAFIDRGKHFAQEFPKAKLVIDKMIPSLSALQKRVQQVQSTMATHWDDAGLKLKDLKDAFQTNMGLIARTIGLHTAEGRRLMNTNINQMISHTVESMNKGKTSVRAGMQAIQDSIDKGIRNGAITTTKGMRDILNALTNLHNHGRITALQFSRDLINTFQTYARRGANIWSGGTDQILQSLVKLRNQGKITMQQLMDQVNTLWKSGVANLNKQTDGWFNTQVAYYKRMRANNTLTQKEYNADIASLEQDRNSRSKGNIEAWAQNILNGMVQSGKISLSGAQSIAKQLNELLSGLHASKIPVPTSVAVAAYQASHGLASGPGHRGATGALWQVGTPGQAGEDTVPMLIGNEQYRVAPGEQVVVINRHQQPDFNARFADWGGLAGYFAGNKRPHNMATGGYVYPFSAGTQLERTDMGVDASMPVGAPIGPIGRARVGQQYGNWYAGQPFMHWQLLDGPDAGQWVYLAEQIVPMAGAGQVVQANQAVARFAPSGTGIEMGWGTAGQATLAQATGNTGGPSHDNSPAGLAFRAFLIGLSHGQIVGGGGISDPRVRGPDGPYKTAVQKSLDQGTAAANSYYQSKLAALSPGMGNFSFASRGPVEQRIKADASRVGVNKIGIAGIIGNAYAESTIDPASKVGDAGGLFGFTPLSPEMAFAQSRGTQWTDVDTQMAYMFNQWFAQDPGAISAINRSGSPSAAALYFMNTYERPGIPRADVRTSAAVAAYAQGYQRGGIAHGPHGRLHGVPGARLRSPHHHPRLKPDQLRHRYPRAWDFIRKVSPDFPPQDVGEHWLKFLNDRLDWKAIEPRYLTEKYLDDLTKWLQHVNGQRGIVATLQDRENQLSSMWSSPTGAQKRKLVGLDRDAVGWMLRSVHSIDRLIGGLHGNGPLDRLIHDLSKGDPPPGWPRVSTVAAKGQKHSPHDQRLAFFQGKRKTLHGMLGNLLGLSGISGTLGGAEQTLVGELGQSSTRGARTAQRLALEKQENALLREKLALMRAQYRVLDQNGGLPPFGGTYARGGTIPGFRGEPRTIIAHAGEKITPVDQSGPDYIVVTPDVPGFGRLIHAEVQRNGSTVSRTASYGLPSRGGR